MKKTTSCFAFLMVACLCMSASSFALLTFDAILLDIEPVDWFDAGTGQFQMVDGGGSTSILVEAGDLRVAGDLAYDYAFDGTITITPSDLLGANGDFAAFADNASNVIATMTITASQVYEKGGSPIAGLGPVLLQAQMVTENGYWYMSEDPGDATSYAGNVDYLMTGGELFDGTQIKMNDFNATYKMQDTSPINGSFLETMTSAHPQITLVAEIPEPATMVLLGLGGLLIRRKK